MNALFLRIVNMSIAACWILLAVLLLRLVLRKAPKWIMVLLWGLVALRLVCPFFTESKLSMIPSSETVSPTIMTDNPPQIHTGIAYFNSSINPMISENFAPSPETSINPLQIWIPVLAMVWLVGLCLMLAYMGFSYWRLRRKMATAVRYSENIYQSDRVQAPFVLGFFKPRIYLPFHISEQDLPHVIAHEKAHIRRKDHWWKPLGFILLSIHWFNPLIWLGYVFLCRDIELACDEKVIKELGKDERADYSQALLSCSVRRRSISACPLAFGQGSVRKRVKSVLSYKKPAFWILISAIVAIIGLAVFFLTDPADDVNPDATEPPVEDTSTQPEETVPSIENITWIPDTQTLAKKYPNYFDLPTDKGLAVYIWQMAPNSYSCALLPGRNLPHTQSELFDYHRSGTTIEEMRAIVSTYNLDQDMVSINPIQMWHSSYAYTIDEEYTKQLEELFWNGTPMTTPAHKGYIDQASFDIDGDGEIEHCTLGYVPTSGRFTFKIHVQDDDREYSDIFGCEAGELSFAQTEDGWKIRQELYHSSQIIYYDFSIQDGNVVLSHNG